MYAPSGGTGVDYTVYFYLGTENGIYVHIQYFARVVFISYLYIHDDLKSLRSFRESQTLILLQKYIIFLRVYCI